MELKVWIGSVQRIISGVSINTTSHEVIVALAQATGKTGRFTLIEKWRDYEKTLAPSDCPLVVAQKFGDYAHEVQFILRQTGEVSAAPSTNRRLAEAKSPKPQRRRGGIKKSLSFSGGPQTNSPNRSPRPSNLHQSIPEEEVSVPHNRIDGSNHMGVANQPSDKYTTAYKRIERPEYTFHPINPSYEYNEPTAHGEKSKKPNHSKLKTREQRNRSRERRNREHTSPQHVVDNPYLDQPPPYSRTQPSEDLSSSLHDSRTGRTAGHPIYGRMTASHHSDYPSNNIDASQSREEQRRKEKRMAEKLKEEKAMAEREAVIREGLELQQTLANHERKLAEEHRKLTNLDQDIARVTLEEEKKWSDLYDCRDEITTAIATVQRLEIELDECDEVLLSEELNVLLRKRDEMQEEINEIHLKLSEYDSQLKTSTDKSKELSEKLESINLDNKALESEITDHEDQINKLQQRVEEKKRFLMEAEDGYMSACDDLKEAENSLEERKRMLVELERELREYNLKSFISTGINEKIGPEILFEEKKLKLVNSSELYV